MRYSSPCRTPRSCGRHTSRRPNAGQASRVRDQSGAFRQWRCRERRHGHRSDRVRDLCYRASPARSSAANSGGSPLLLRSAPAANLVQARSGNCLAHHQGAAGLRGSCGQHQSSFGRRPFAHTRLNRLSPRSNRWLGAIWGGPTGPEGVYTTFTADQVEKQVSLISGSASPRYPEALRIAGVEGQVVARFVVDGEGRVEEGTVKFVRSDNPLFDDAVRSALSRMRFAPAEIAGKKVRQLVEMPFVFALSR